MIEEKQFIIAYYRLMISGPNINNIAAIAKTKQLRIEKSGLISVKDYKLIYLKDRLKTYVDNLLKELFEEYRFLNERQVIEAVFRYHGKIKR